MKLKGRNAERECNRMEPEMGVWVDSDALKVNRGTKGWNTFMNQTWPAFVGVVSWEAGAVALANSRLRRRILLPALHAAAVPLPFWVLVSPMIFAWQAVTGPLLMSELLTGWKRGGTRGGCEGCPRGCGMPMSGYAPVLCAFHPSSSTTAFASKIEVPVLVVPIV